jgi:citrate lyase subunit beta / citryl-CoA lyase
MKFRSMLLVPSDSERKSAKAATIGVDALILDLEDSVAPTRKLMFRASLMTFPSAIGDFLCALIRSTQG